jgi:hypothetical protein
MESVSLGTCSGDFSKPDFHLIHRSQIEESFSAILFQGRRATSHFGQLIRFFSSYSALFGGWTKWTGWTDALPLGEAYERLPFRASSFHLD